MEKVGAVPERRQWGTVREDYSADGDAWDYFPHDHARSRAYRWGEDGIAGISDDQQRLCFALALWNGRDPILKERLFGLTNSEGNHGEDVKECYYYLDATPTHSYLKMLYKYPQAEFPYARLVEENRRRGKRRAGVRADRHRRLRRRPLLRRLRRIRQGRRRDDILIAITVHNRGPEAGRRCTSCRSSGSATPGRGSDRVRKPRAARATTPCTSRPASGAGRLSAATATGAPSCCSARTRPTSARLFGGNEPTATSRTRFHEYVVDGERRRRQSGADAARRPRAHYRAQRARRAARAVVRLRLSTHAQRRRRSATSIACSTSGSARPTSSTRHCSAASPTPTRGACSARRSPA